MLTENVQYTRVQMGQLAGVGSATQLPDVQCALVSFKALGVNTGMVYLGGAGVTVDGTATNTTTGFELDAGDATPWIPVDNLNRLYRICDSTADHLSYIALSL